MSFRPLEVVSLDVELLEVTTGVMAIVTALLKWRARTELMVSML